MNDLNFYKETERLILRSPIDGDAEILAAKRSTEFVMRYNLYRPCDALQIKKEFELFEHVVMTLKDGSVIGCISVRDDYLRYGVDSRSLQAWLSEDAAYQGYMAEALAVMIDHLLSEGQCERVSGQVFANNRASLRLVEKLGFRQEGYLKRAIKNHLGEVFDLVLFSIDRPTYLEKHGE